ncbi:MAG: winged helix-turn-helix transcriptional regulator, partial [Tidjanibacter sp.]|nr:winged helix-turn-helix transcriptional regulator [Tidjanibacter sp.]
FVARSAEGAINYTLCDVNVSMLRQEMQKVVATLPEVRRKIYLLSSEQNMTNAEIAQALGISVKTVETQLGRVTAAMRRKLAPYL